MQFLTAIAILFLAINLIRFVIGAVVIVINGQIAGKPAPTWLRAWNIVETSLIVWVFVKLIMFYYGW